MKLEEKCVANKRFSRGRAILPVHPQQHSVEFNTPTPHNLEAVLPRLPQLNIFTRASCADSPFDRSRVVAWKLLRKQVMNSSGHLTVSETATKRVRKTKASTRKPKGRSRNGSTKPSSADIPAAGTLARTKALLLAALRMWELKHRVGD